MFSCRAHRWRASFPGCMIFFARMMVPLKRCSPSGVRKLDLKMCLLPRWRKAAKRSRERKQVLKSSTSVVLPCSRARKHAKTSFHEVPHCAEAPRRRLLCRHHASKVPGRSLTKEGASVLHPHNNLEQ